VGRLIDTKTRQDITQARRDELMKVDFAKLPLDQAVRLRVGKGTRQFVTFEDPNCPYCRKLHRDLAAMKDVTVHAFLYPILSPDSFEKAKNIWCSKDRAAAWNAAMIDGKAPAAAGADCKHPLQQNLHADPDLPGRQPPARRGHGRGNREAAGVDQEVARRAARVGAAERVTGDPRGSVPDAASAGYWELSGEPSGAASAASGVMPFGNSSQALTS
jgi:hypothetical protein